MRNLGAGLLTQLSPKAREQAALREALDEIIDRLERQRVELQQRLSMEAEGAKKRRLKTSAEVAKLQLKKAVALRSNLPRY
jgi:hypothetical protein